MAKTDKAPGVFKKPVDKDKWNKKFLNRLYLPEDRKFLESITEEKDGLVRIKIETLSPNELKRLKSLGKVIKKNRKKVSFSLILILAVVAAGLVFFQFHLKNRLARDLVENGLERVFLAQVEAADVNLSVLKGNFSIGRLTIADSASPMTNLAEFLSVKAEISTPELLQGRLFIEELGFSGMKRGTPRTVSGELESSTDGGKEEKTDGESSGNDPVAEIAGRISALAGTIDPAGIIEQQRENLESFAVIERSGTTVEGYAAYWQADAEKWGNRIGDWENSINYIGSLNAGSFSTVESARAAISGLQDIYNRAERDLNEIEADYSAAEQQIAAGAEIAEEVNRAIDADYRYIESLVSLPASGKADWASSILEEKLSLPLKEYMYRIERGLEWYNRFQRFAEKRARLRPGKRRSGRSLPPAADAPPAFTLVRAYGSGEEPGTVYRFELNNFVSEPEKWAEETSLEIDFSTAETGPAAVRITENSMDLEIPAAPFALGNSLGALDVGAFAGVLKLNAEAGWDNTGFSGDLELVTADLKLEESVPDSLLYRLISKSIEAASPISAVGSFTVDSAGTPDIKIDTGLDDSLSAVVGELLSEGADEGIEMLKQYLEAELNGPLSDFSAVREDFEGYVEQIDSYRGELDDLQGAADKKMDEIEKAVQDKLQKQAEELLKDAVSDDARKQIEDAGDAIKKGIGGMLNF